MNAPLTTPTGGSVATGVPLPLSDSVPGDRPRFRRSFRLRFSATAADRLSIDAGAVRLGGRFLVLDHVVAGSAGGITVPASVTPSGSTLIVSTAAPARVRKVKIEAASGQTAAQISARLFRMDGDVKAKESTVAQSNDTVIGHDFTDRRFAVGITHGGADTPLAAARLQRLEMRGYPTGARLGLILPGESEPTFFMTIPGEAERGGDSPTGEFPAATTGALLAAALQRGLDALARPLAETVDVTLVAESDAPCALRIDPVVVPYDLARTTFRVALLRTADVTAAGPLLTRLREGSEPVAAFLHARLAPEVGHAVDGSPASGRPSSALIGAVVADLNRIIQVETLYTPARFAHIDLPADVLATVLASPTGIGRTRLNRRLLELAFPAELAPLGDPADENKHVARDADAPRQFSVDVPGQADVVSARVRFSASLRADAHAALANTDTADPDDDAAFTGWETAPPADRGAAVNADAAAATAVALDAPLELSGIALALLPLAHATELIIEVREDAGGPAGRVLGSGRVTLGAIDRATWVTASFARPIAISTARHWIVARAAAGSAVWLGVAGSGETRVADNSAPPGGWKDRGRLDGLSALFQLRARGAPATATAAEPGGGGDGGASDARFRLRLAGQSIVPQPLGDDNFEADFTLALRDHLALITGPVLPLVDVAVEIATVGQGLITVYPPEVHFAL